MSKSHSDARTTVSRLLGSGVIAYHPALAAVAGSVGAGLFLAQLFYWHDRGADPDGWIYKTQAQWHRETGLTRWQQQTARRHLRQRGLLDERLAGIPARLHYRLDTDRLVQLLTAHLPPSPSQAPQHAPPPPAPPTPAPDPHPSLRESHKQARGVPADKPAAGPHAGATGSHTHAETTTEHSTEHRSETPAAGFSSASSDSRREPLCSIHRVPMRLRQKDGDTWYSHRLPDGTWCRGAPGDQPPDPADDPWSPEHRRAYLAWADPSAALRLTRPLPPAVPTAAPVG